MSRPERPVPRSSHHGLDAICGRLPHVFRQYKLTAPSDAPQVAAAAEAAARDLQARTLGLEAWAVYRSVDGLRVVTVERWREGRAYRQHGSAGDLAMLRPDTAL